MKAVHINPFLNATLNLMENMTGRIPIPGQKSLLQHFHSHRWDVSGVIGVTGNAEGIIAIRMTRNMVERLLDASNIFYDDMEEFNDLTNSLIGEIANVIAGNALSEISQYNLNITVPIVIQGKDHTIAWPRNNPIIVIPFSSAYGPFEVCVSLKESLLRSFM
ncbi:MAG: chemotaxis protein CheX [Spirochaetales bacterium]|nr:chemotaxis protein CheX [Spirochaetales bacterium]